MSDPIVMLYHPSNSSRYLVHLEVCIRGFHTICMIGGAAQDLNAELVSVQIGVVVWSDKIMAQNASTAF